MNRSACTSLLVAIGYLNCLAEVIPAPEVGGSFIHEAQTRTVGLDFSVTLAGA